MGNFECLTTKVKKLGGDSLSVLLQGERGILAANIIVNLNSGVINGHIDAACVADEDCLGNVKSVLNNIHSILPALHTIGSSVNNINIDDCSNHPAGGVNLSINANIE